jgi:hypothetical protein
MGMNEGVERNYSDVHAAEKVVTTQGPCGCSRYDRLASTPENDGVSLPLLYYYQS